MRIDLNNKLRRKLKKISKKNIQLYDTFLEKLELLRKDPEHSSLKIHKLSGKSGGIYSFSVTYKVRVLFIFSDDGILLTDIGSHDEVY